MLVCAWAWCCTESDPYSSSPRSAPLSELDQLVLADLDRLGIPPAALCSDAVFVRRAFLDVIGTLPTAREVRAFLEDPAPDKRARLVEHLLTRPEFADYWTMKWSDLLRVKAEFPVNLWPNAAQAYLRWILASVHAYQPLDRFTRELLVTVLESPRPAPRVHLLSATPVQIPLGGTAAVTLGVPFPRWAAQFQLDLNDAPEGLALAGVAPSRRGVEVRLRAEGGQLQPGRKGNLILSARAPRANTPANRVTAAPVLRRGPVAVLPAIPFEIVAGGR